MASGFTREVAEAYAQNRRAAVASSTDATMRPRPSEGVRRLDWLLSDHIIGGLVRDEEYASLRLGEQVEKIWMLVLREGARRVPPPRVVSGDGADVRLDVTYSATPLRLPNDERSGQFVQWIPQELQDDGPASDPPPMGKSYRRSFLSLILILALSRNPSQYATCFLLSFMLSTDCCSPQAYLTKFHW